MKSTLTIVMYHYVRDLSRSRYPAIKGRNLIEFRGQLDHIARTYEIVTAEEVMAALLGELDLPSNAAWLTFDDGYLDHYTNVFPILHDRGWQGSFFSPARTILEGTLLDVNKVHFVLAAQKDTAPIIEAIRGFVGDHGQTEGVHSFECYWKSLRGSSRYDPPDVVFIKRILQYGLPETLRNDLTDYLFDRFVSVDQKAFSAELYLSFDQACAMVRCGMYFGSHGNNHYWLDKVDTDQQVSEIDNSLSFLAEVGARTDRWVMCYPNGAYNDSLLDLLRARGCVVGLTTFPGVSHIGTDSPLELPRLDTNDIPVQ